MKKLVNRLDHVAWVSRLETLDENIARLEALSGARLERFRRDDMGIMICVDWAAGLEILAPLAERGPGNQALHDHLDARGEGVFAVVFGVDDMARHRARLAPLGHQLSDPLDDHADSPWHHRLRLEERLAGDFLGGAFVLGDIDYADELVRVRDV